MRNRAIVMSAVLLAALALTGCQTLDSNTAFNLESADSHEPGAMRDLYEQQFYTDEISDSFQSWLVSAGWDTSYKVDKPIRWIPQETDSAFPSTISSEKCDAWIEWESGYQPASVTSAYVYRVTDNDKAATSKDIGEILAHLSSDLKRQGWEKYDTSLIGSAEGIAGQDAWYVPLVDGADYEPVPTYVPDTSGEPDTDYISYRLMAADRGDGYITLYISAPCAALSQSEYDFLKSDLGSTELDIIDSDTKNVIDTTKQ